MIPLAAAVAGSPPGSTRTGRGVTRGGTRLGGGSPSRAALIKLLQGGDAAEQYGALSALRELEHDAWAEGSAELLPGQSPPVDDHTGAIYVRDREGSGIRLRGGPRMSLVAGFTSS